MGGSPPSTTRTIQDIPSEFKPAYTALYNSAFGAARQGAYPNLMMPASMGQMGDYSPGSALGMMGFGGQGGQLMPGGGGGKGAQPGQSMIQPMPPSGNQAAGGKGAQPGQGMTSGLGQNVASPWGVSSQGQQPADGGGFSQSNLMAGQTGAVPQPAGIADTGTLPSGQPLTPGTGAAPKPTGGGKGPARAGRPRGRGGRNTQGSPQIPSGNVWGSNQIPLAGGEPIVGQPFPGPFTAPTNPLEAMGQWGKLGAAGRMGDLGGNLLNMGQAQAGGAFLNPQSNPYLAQTMQYAMRPAIEQFTRSILPGMESQAIQSGAFKGSSARDMATAQLGSDFGRNLMGTTAAMGMQNYGQERQLQQNAGSVLDQAARLMQLQPELLSQAGQAFRGFDQRRLDEMLLNFQEQVQAPFRPLMPLASIIQGGDIGRDITQMSPQPSRGASGILGALGGAGLGANIAGTAGWGGAGTAASTGLGAAAGGLASFL